MLHLKKLNGGCKFWIEVQNNRCSDALNKLKFAKISRKDLLCMKMEQMDRENLIIVALKESQK